MQSVTSNNIRVGKINTFILEGLSASVGFRVLQYRWIVFFHKKGVSFGSASQSSIKLHFYSIKNNP